MTPEEVRQSVLGARAFYLLTYCFFYLSTTLYYSKLSEWHEDGKYFKLTLYFGSHLIAFYTFLTTCSDPGFVNQDYQQL